jgi:hypothetical protein
MDTELDPIIKQCNEIENRNLGEEERYLEEEIEHASKYGTYLSPATKKGEKVPLKYYHLLTNPHAKSDKEKYETLNKETLQKIKNLQDSIIAKNGEPLVGIDLAGVKKERLKKLPSYGKINLRESWSKFAATLEERQLQDFE